MTVSNIYSLVRLILWIIVFELLLSNGLHEFIQLCNLLV